MLWIGEYFGVLAHCIGLDAYEGLLSEILEILKRVTPAGTKWPFRVAPPLGTTLVNAIGMGGWTLFIIISLKEMSVEYIP